MTNTPDEVAREEFVDSIRAEYKEEIREEILDELGEEYVVWVRTDAAEIQAQISLVATALNSLMRVVQGDNQLPDQEQVLSRIERAQLIAILEAAIQELKAPMIDRGRFRSLQRGLVRVAAKAAENAASVTIQNAVRLAANELGALVTKLLDQTGYDDWLS